MDAESLVGLIPPITVIALMLGVRLHRAVKRLERRLAEEAIRHAAVHVAAEMHGRPCVWCNVGPDLQDKDATPAPLPKAIVLRK